MKIEDKTRNAIITALKEMKNQEDKSADSTASQDSPNATHHLEMAEKAKEKIDHYIALLEALSYESTETLIINEIIKVAIEESKEDKQLEQL